MFVPFIIPFLAGFVILFFRLTKKKAVYISFALSFILVFSIFAAVFSLTYNKNTVIIVSPGKSGDYVAVTEGGKCTVFDCTEGSIDGFYPLTEKLLSLGITRADFVIVSKPSARHVQSLVRACSYFDIDRVYTSSEISELAALLCIREVIPYDDITAEFGYAAVTVLTGARYVSAGSGVYCFGGDCTDMGYAKRFKTVIYGSAVCDAPHDDENTYYTEYNKGIRVIYVDS